jgi:hypothetical protein
MLLLLLCEIVKNIIHSDSFDESMMEGKCVMLEYIFFDEVPWCHFVDYLRKQGLALETLKREGEWLVYIQEDLDEDLDDKIEAYYDECLEMNENLVAAREGKDHVYHAGLNVTLADGRVVQAPIDPGLISRLLDVVSTEELGDFVSTIANAVEGVDKKPLYRR